MTRDEIGQAIALLAKHDPSTTEDPPPVVVLLKVVCDQEHIEAIAFEVRVTPHLRAKARYHDATESNVIELLRAGTGLKFRR